MQVFRSMEEFPSDDLRSVLSVGNFDGVHCAHREVLRKVVESAQSLGARSLAVTFDPHPMRVLRPDAAPKLITSLPMKLRLLEQTGVDAVLVIPFSSNISAMSPRKFSEEILAKRIRALEIYEGNDFRFGHKAEGNVEQLKEFGRTLGFEVKIYPDSKIRGQTVSSSCVRQLLREGGVARARHLLGRAFSITSTPEPGRGYGHKYAVPTINLAPYQEAIPANGVYITEMRIAGERFPAVTNVGNRPTFGEDSFAIESYLLNVSEITLQVDTEIELSFFEYLRPEKKWPDTDALKRQIGKDVTKAQRFFALRSALTGSR